MISYNLTPFTGTIDDPARLKQMALVKSPLKTKFEGKTEQIRTHIQEFIRRMHNTGLYQEFQIKLRENDKPDDIPEDEWTQDHPLRWQTANFLDNFAAVSFSALSQERENINDVLAMLDTAPQTRDDEGAKELASKQHSMWIAELLDNSWSDQVTSDMSAFEEETMGDGILLFYVFLREHVGYTKEAIIAAEQQLTKEKLALDNFQHDIGKFTAHVRLHIRQIMNAGSPVTNQHFILVFSALKESTEDEFKLTIMRLYESWRTGTGDGANLTIIQLLARADSEYKRLVQLGQWTAKQKASELLGLQAKIESLHTQFIALAAENTKLKTKVQSSSRPTGAPKEEENEERTVNGIKWFYCGKCWSGRRWNTTHKTDQHKRGVGRNKNGNDNANNDGQGQQIANHASYDLGYGSDFHSG
jgi:hypothetical protein